MGNKRSVRQIGRFDYVEPLNAELDMTDNVMFKAPEDYSISVNLEVEIPSRYYQENPIRLYASSDNGTITFFGGTNNNLTTSWTDISVNSDNNRECLGIESINITYNSNFFPVVTIRFVDVRGASLFMPEEKAFYQQQKDSDDITQLNSSSFYKALLAFPPPIVKLTVKGFYGKPVTFELALSKFDSDFDSESGNFIVNVQFIGYMYGIYTELPMSYIACAPYIDGKKYWDAKVASGYFRFNNLAKMPTIPEFVKEYSSAISKAKQGVMASNEGRKVTHLKDIKSSLIKLRDEFPFKDFRKCDDFICGGINSNSIVTSTDELLDNTQVQYNSQSRIDKIYSKSKQAYFYIEKDKNNETLMNGIVNETTIKSYLSLLKTLKDYDSKYISYLTDFNEILSDYEYDTKYVGEKLRPIHSKYRVTSNSGVKSFNPQKIYYKVENNDKLKLKTTQLYCAHNWNNGEDTITTNVNDFYKRILNSYYFDNGNLDSQKNNTTYILYQINTNILIDIDKELYEIENKLKDAENDLFEKEKLLINEELGYQPTIQNIYEMVFAHVDTFMYHFFNCLNETKNDKAREGLNEGNSDVTNDAKKIPPFPKVFVEDKSLKTFKEEWPYEVLQKHIPETRFVESILRASLQLYEDVREAIENSERESGADLNISTENKLPLVPIDFIPNINTNNPYQEIYKYYEEGSSTQSIVNRIRFVFIMRCIYFALMFKRCRIERTYSNRNETDDFVRVAKKYIAYFEVCNIKKAFGNEIPNEILLEIVNETKFDKFLSGIANGNGKQEIKNPYNEQVWNNWNNLGIDTNKYIKTIDNNNYMIIPIKNYFDESVIRELEDDTCLSDSENYIVVKLGGSGKAIDNTITEEVDGKILNEKSVSIVDNDSLFKNIGELIVTDSDFKDATDGDDISNFLNEFFTNYLGSRININNSYDGGASNSNLLEEVYIIKDNYSWLNNDMPQYYFCKLSENDNGDRTKTGISYSDIINNKENNNVFVVSPATSSAKKYTSFVNGNACVDTINVISNGCSIDDLKTHCPDNCYTQREIPSILKNTASVFTKAYFFLFSLPISKEYVKYSLLSNMKLINKAVLLREGAQYYWEDNTNTMYGDISEEVRGNIESYSIPIVDDYGNSKKTAPTLWMETGKTYLTWSVFSNDIPVPKNRREYLKNYFSEWARSEFSTLNSSLMLENSNFNASLEGWQSEVLSKFLLDEVQYIDYATPIVSYVSKSTDGIYIDTNSSYIKNIYENFVPVINKFYSETIENTTNEVIRKGGIEETINSSIDIRLSLYRTLQTLYDKFIAGNRVNRWKLGEMQLDGKRLYVGESAESDFQRFNYLDSFYNEIGNRLILNAKYVYDLFTGVTSDISNTTNSEVLSQSLFNFLSSVCQKNGLNLITLPISPTSKGIGIDSLFETLSWSQSYDNQDNKTCFVAMYTYSPSKYLDIKDNSNQFGYPDDGWDIDYNRMPLTLTQVTESGNRVPSFAVSYGRQNQSIFRKVNVSTANRSQTEAAIATTLNIASKADSTPRDSHITYGQDLYPVYANYSYTCDVEMLGCAPIMPLMYFQLNNIPMFRGAYMIYNVEHSIVAGNMTTKFKGMRMSKYAVPLVNGEVVFNQDYGTFVHTGGLQGYVQGKPLINENGDAYGAIIYSNSSNDDNSDNENIKYGNINDMKKKVAIAFRTIFRDGDCPGSNGSLCSRYTYDLAYTLCNGKNGCGVPAGGNANQSSYWKNLESLGYELSDILYFQNVNEIKYYMSTRHFNYGDIAVYYSNSGSKEDSSRKYGHTQMFIGDAVGAECSNGWACDKKDNYNTPFVYGRRTMQRDWELRIYKPPTNVA